MAFFTRALCFRVLRCVTIMLVMLLQVAATLLYWLMGTTSGAHWVLHRGLPYAQRSLPDNMQLEIQKITATTLADIHIGQLQLADRDGVWLDVKNFTLRWHPSALWKQQLHITDLTAGEATLSRLPVDDTPPPPVQEQIRSGLGMIESLPDTLRQLQLPPIRLDTLRITELRLPQELTQAVTTYTLSGTLDFIGSPRGKLTFKSLSGAETTAEIRLDSPQNSNATLHSHWREAQGGLLGSILPLATPAALDITIASQLEETVWQTRIHALAGEATLLDAQLQLPEGSAVRIAWQARLPQPLLLSPLAALPDALETTGTLDTEALHITLDTPRYAPEGKDAFLALHAKAKLALDEFFTPLHLQAAFHAEQPDSTPLTAVITAKGDSNHWTLQSLTVNMGETTALTADGHINIASGAAELRARYDLPQLSGQFAAHAEALWDAPSLTAELRLDDIHQPLPAPFDTVATLPLVVQLQTEDAEKQHYRWHVKAAHIRGDGAIYLTQQEQHPLASGEIHVTGLPSELTLAVRHMASGDGEVEIRSATATLTAQYHTDNAATIVSPIRLHAGDALDLQGSITVSHDTALAQGKLQGTLHHMQPLTQFGLSVPAVKAVNGLVNVTLDSVRQQQRIALNYQSGKFSLDGSHLADNVTLRAIATLPTDASAILDSTLEVAGLTYPMMPQQLILTAKGDSSALDWGITGGDAANKSLEIRGSLATGDGVSLTLSRLMLAWQDSQLTLQSPTQLHYANHALLLNTTTLKLNDSTLTAKLSLNPNTVNGNITLTSLPLRNLPFGALPSTHGTVKATLTMGGMAENPDITLAMEVEGLQNNYPDLTRMHDAPLMVNLDAALKARQLTATLYAHAPQEKSEAKLVAKLPVDISLSPTQPRFATEGTLQADLDADLILGPFLPLVLPDGVYGTGHLVADMQVRGTLDKPNLHGTIRLRNGEVEVLQSGTQIMDLRFNASAEGNRISLREGAASDGGDGTMTFSGDIRLTPTLPMEVKAGVSKFTALRHSNAIATVSGDMTLDGDLQDASLKGKWTIDSARISIQNGSGGGGSVPEIRVVEVASLDEPLHDIDLAAMSEAERIAARERRRQQRPFSRNLKLDIQIGAENQIFLEGFGLNAELKGKVNIAGTAADPALSGKMGTIRGRWEFFGRTFTIARGEATLSENNLTAPLIDLHAETQADDIRAIAKITGTTEKPDIKFSSIPSLPQDEILSRVMFGKNLNSISPYQALQLADMIRSLSGKGGGGLNPLSKLQNTLGIDELRINNDGGSGEDMTVGVGKYLQDNIYLEVEGGSAQNSGKVSVEVDLTPNISVETETRQSADSAIRLNYKYDY